jgi:hypothetical protein
MLKIHVIYTIKSRSRQNPRYNGESWSIYLKLWLQYNQMHAVQIVAVFQLARDIQNHDVAA